MFPLTPALSLREREKHRQRVGEMLVLFLELFESRVRQLPPLPEGEGWGALPLN